MSFDYHLSLLDEEEKFHAARFHFRQDREQSILARASLRSLMARYTGFAPERIRFRKNQYGKLFLQYPDSSVQFNVTHSGDCVIHAIACGAEIGVDVETFRISVRSDRFPHILQLVSRPGWTRWLMMREMMRFSYYGPARRHTSKRWDEGFPSLWTASRLAS